MIAQKALRAKLFTVILLSGSILSVLLPPVVQAENIQGYSTFYFTNALNLTNEEGFSLLTQTHPTKQTDSEYPPSIFAKGQGTGENKTILSQEWISWLLLAGVSQLLGNLSEDDMENFNDYGGFLEGFELLFSGPSRISESYTYMGNDTIRVQGDVLYRLYFSDTSKIKSQTDSVNVALYTWNMMGIESIADFLPKLIKNTTVRLTPPYLFGGIYAQQVTLSDVDFTVSPGESIFAVIEINQTEKPNPLLDFLNRPIIKQMIEGMINRWISGTFIGPIRRQLGSLINNITTTMKEAEINFTSQDLATFINIMKSTKFIYDSQAHPASVTFPAQISEKDIRTFYFVSNNKLSETQQDGTNSSKTKILTTPTLWTMNHGLERNKILKIHNVSAELYFQRYLCLIPRKIGITVTLYENENTTLASTEIQLTKNKLQGFLRKKVVPILVNFTGVDKELTYGHTLSIGVSLANGTKSTITPLFLQPPSPTYPSLLRVEFEETHNIKIHNLTITPSNGQIIPGGSVRYLFNVTSVHSDILQIRTIEREKIGSWVISTPSSIPVSANSWVTFPLYVNSTEVLKEAYGGTIDLIVVITGNTGIAREPILAEISEEAIYYNVEILGYSNTINVSKGENRTFYFIIKNNNTGAIDDTDSYTITASSQNQWPLIPRTNIKDLRRGESTDPTTARVLIQVPKKTNKTSDVITITVTSDGNSDASATISITVKVIGGGFLEELFDIFDSAAKALGLTDIFGSDGAWVLGIILVVIIIFILIILALLITTKPVQIICTDRIKEIEGTEKAIFELTLKNQSKKTQTFELQALQTGLSAKWITSIEPAVTIIEGRQSKPVQIVVIPTENAEAKDWTQVTVQVKKTGKKKSESIALLAMIKEGKTLLQIQNVSHWPTPFNPGEKITTSFSVMNNGTVAARNVKVFFYLNGKQKNTLEVTIPAGSIADIQMPWIAEKGKNQVRIRLKEQ